MYEILSFVVHIIIVFVFALPLALVALSIAYVQSNETLAIILFVIAVGVQALLMINSINMLKAS